MNGNKALSIFLVLTLLLCVFSACAEKTEPDTKQKAGPDIIYNGGNYVYTVIDKNGSPASKDIRDGIIDFIRTFIVDYDDSLVEPIDDSDILIAIPGCYDNQFVINKYQSFGTLNFRDPDGNIRLDYTSVKNAEAMIDEKSDEPYITIYFTDEGAKIFEALTREISEKEDGDNYLSIYVGERLFSSPTVTSPLSGGEAVITSSAFAENPEQVTSLTNAINSEYSKNYTLQHSYEIEVAEEEKAQWEEESREKVTKVFYKAIADALTKQTGDTYYSKNIDSALMSKYTSFIYTLQADESSVENTDAQYPIYRPVIILGTEKYTEWYIQNHYLTDTETVTEEDENTPEHLVFEFDFKNVDVLALFENLEVLHISGYVSRSLYDYYLNYGSGDSSMDETVLSIYQHYNAVDMTELTSLSMIPNLEKIKYLSIGYSGITSLEGIEKAKNLEYLEATGCGLTDIKALSKITTVKRIDISYNELTSLKGIEGSKELVVGKFNCNRLTSLDALYATSKLTTLEVTGNALVNLNGIEGNKDTLVNLYAGDNVDYEIKEKAQNAYDEKYEDVHEEGLNEAELAAMKEAQNNLRTAGRTLEDINALDGFTALEVLDVSGNKIEDISCVSSLTALKTLTADDNAISDLGGINNAKALTVLTLSNNEIVDISEISYLVDITTLQLSGNKIDKLVDLSSLTAITVLELAHNEFESISALGDLATVSTVDFSNNEKLTDISDFDSVFDSAVLKFADFSLSVGNDEGDGTNISIVDWTPILSFAETTFAGVPEDVLSEIEK